jgi:acyl-CoA reductase-like NAD-dependent aldehyde dehydrogenase
VVLADADLEGAVAGIMFGVFLNQGECCCAATRILVHESLHDAFTEKFVAAAKGIRIGPPLDEATRMGPLVTQDHWNTVSGYVQSGIDEGAKLLCGGPGKPAGLEKGYYLAPTVFDEVTPGMKIYREEIFGPVVTITTFENFNEAAEMANDSHYGLAASIWTTNLRDGHVMAQKVKAGTVWLNVHNFVFSTAPYGGYKMSGLGRELGRQGLEAFLETKNVMVWLGEGPFSWY